MITAVIQIKLPEGKSRSDVVKAFKASAPNYQGMAGLVRKYFLYGDEGLSGGAYLWESREAAEAIYTADWRKMVAERYGSEPTITYFDTPVVVDNVSGEVISEAE